MKLKPIFLWLILINAMTFTPYTYGPISFTCLLGSLFILLALINQQRENHGLQGFLCHSKQMLEWVEYGICVLALVVLTVFVIWWSNPESIFVHKRAALQPGSLLLCLLLLVVASGVILWQKDNPHKHMSDSTRALTLKIVTRLCLLVLMAFGLFGFIQNPDWIVDIGANTFAAVEHFVEGNNPYTHKAQLWVETFPPGTPNLAVEDGQITMYGVPYYHGYPYFPAMLLSYTPFYEFTGDKNAIRLANLFFILCNIGCFWFICQKALAEKKQQRAAFTLATLAYIGVLRYGFEALTLGITDVQISWLLMAGFTALYYDKLLIAGIFIGLAQASKLLPAPLVFLTLLYLFLQNKNLWRIIVGFSIGAFSAILPFFLWNPEGFLSSTILYYLTHHEAGDLTSLWYYLPELLQTPFMILGFALTLASLLILVKKGEKSLVAGLASGYAGYVVLMAFSKMTHINYLWAVYPLGCIALALLVQNTEEEAF